MARARFLRELTADLPDNGRFTCLYRRGLAIRIIADQLDSFATGHNQYVHDLHHIVTASYEKRGLFAR